MPSILRVCECSRQPWWMTMASSCSVRVCKRSVSWLLSSCHSALRWVFCWPLHSPSRTPTSSRFGLGAYAAVGLRCIRRIIVGAVDKVSGCARPRSDPQPAHRLVSHDGRPVCGVGDRRRHLGAPHSPDAWELERPLSLAAVCTWPGSLRRCGCYRRLTRRRTDFRVTTTMPWCLVTWEHSWCYGPLSLWFSRGSRARCSMPSPIGINGRKPDGPHGDSAIPPRCGGHK